MTKNLFNIARNLQNIFNPIVVLTFLKPEIFRILLAHNFCIIFSLHPWRFRYHSLN